MERPHPAHLALAAGLLLLLSGCGGSTAQDHSASDCSVNGENARREAVHPRRAAPYAGGSRLRATERPFPSIQGLPGPPIWGIPDASAHFLLPAGPPVV